MGSGLFRLNKADFLKGLVVSIIVAILLFLKDALSAGGIQFTLETLRNIGNIALTAGIGYILKNLFTDEEGKLGGKLNLE